MKRIALAVLLTVALLAASAVGAQPASGTAAGGSDPIGRYLYPPEAVLGQAQELALTDAQRIGIRSAVHDMQKRFLDLQFDLEERSETISRLLQETPVDEAKVLAAADQVLALESQIKKAQLSLLIRIKNQLTVQQVAKLEGLRGGGS